MWKIVGVSKASVLYIYIYRLLKLLYYFMNVMCKILNDNFERSRFLKGVNFETHWLMDDWCLSLYTYKTKSESAKRKD